MQNCASAQWLVILVSGNRITAGDRERSESYFYVRYVDNFEDNSPSRLAKIHFREKLEDHRMRTTSLSEFCCTPNPLTDQLFTLTLSGTSAAEWCSCDMSSDLVNVLLPDARTPGAISEVDILK